MRVSTGPPGENEDHAPSPFILQTRPEPADQRGTGKTLQATCLSRLPFVLYTLHTCELHSSGGRRGKGSHTPSHPPTESRRFAGF